MHSRLFQPCETASSTYNYSTYTTPRTDLLMDLNSQRALLYSFFSCRRWAFVFVVRVDSMFIYVYESCRYCAHQAPSENNVPPVNRWSNFDNGFGDCKRANCVQSIKSKIVRRRGGENLKSLYCARLVKHSTMM